MEKNNEDAKVLQLKIEIRDIEPKIWRRFLIEDSITFETLHNIIQDVMGWENYHMFDFSIDGKTISHKEEESGFNPAEGMLDKLLDSPEFQKMISKKEFAKEGASLDINEINKILQKSDNKNKERILEITTPIKDFLKNVGKKFIYRYDFGDNWEHELIIEKISEPEQGKKYPVCLEGERVCPPEDCGGIFGYNELAEIKKDKNHPDYEEKIIKWLGEDFDFEEFNTNDVNNLLWGVEGDDGEANEEDYDEIDGEEIKKEMIENFIPLKNLLKEDNEQIKKLKTLFKREAEYSIVLAGIEIPIKSYYQFHKNIKDKDVVKILKNIKANYDKNIDFFQEELEQMIMCMLSITLQTKKITKHEFFLAIDYILWSISNRDYLGPTGYLDWLQDFFPNKY